jgi:hypothetical protein
MPDYFSSLDYTLNVAFNAEMYSGKLKKVILAFKPADPDKCTVKTVQAFIDKLIKLQPLLCTLIDPIGAEIVFKQKVTII